MPAILPLDYHGGRHDGSVQKSDDLNQARKQIDSLNNRLMHLRQRWDNKLVFPLSELGKHYLRKDFGILLDCFLSQSKLGHRESFSLAILHNGANGIDACARRECEIRATVNNGEFPMLIESVHVVDNADGIALGVAPSLVWLQISDQGQNTGIRNPLYLSLISGKFLFRKWLFPKDRELNGVFMATPVVNTREVPNDMVKAGSQMMHDLASQDTKTLGDSECSMIIDSILPFLSVRIGEDWVLAAFEKSDDLAVEITDVLVGPF